ncbi:ABC transporter substrate-binding protein [uncultured Roseibium sp.]|uniref:ABC transporter substrate-binding protein n=1 Tax=uncultured Roseibium sp. TaxID=1936171 RepID=UPI0032165407
MRNIRGMATGLAGLLAMSASNAMAADLSDDVVRIGVLNDMSGVYAAASGKETVDAVQMAVEDFGGKVDGKPVEVVFADHQNKPDVGVAIANKWYDEEAVDVIVDVPGSSIALAIQDIAKSKGKVFIAGGAASADLTGKACSPTGVHYIYDTYSLAKGAADAAVNTLGKTAYFITVDYTFGHQLQGAVEHFMKAAGGESLGSVKHPLGTADFSSYILQAQASGAEVVALANAAGDTANAIKTAREFGLTAGGQKLMALLMMAPDIKGIGLEQAQDLVLVSPFFWSRTPESTAWSRRFHERTGKMPSMSQAGAYSYTMHYLKAIEAAGSDDGKTVVDQMKAMPVDDWFAKGTIREDGRMVHDMYLVQIKKPEESTEEWDFFKLLKVIPGEEIFRPMDKGGCEFVQAAK